MRCVRPAITRVAHYCVGLDYFHQGRGSGVRFRIDDVNARRAKTGHDEIAALHVRVWRIRAKTGTTSVPSKMMQLIAGFWHVHLSYEAAVSFRRRIDIDHSERISAAWLRIQHGNVSDSFRRGLHRH